MKLGPLLTAIAVAIALYGLVFERDRVLGFARGEAPPETGVEQAAAEALATAAPPDEAQTVSVVALDSVAAAIDTAVVLRGQTEAARQVEVRSETAGLVVSQPLRKGALVAAGDVLCRLDPGDRPAALTEAQARLAEARINQSAAERLAEGGFASETRKLSAEAALESARAAVERAELEIARLTLTAPFDGVLETDTAELGALLQPGGACATIIQLDPIKVVGFLPETAISRVSVGAPARATLADGRTLEGQVTFLARSADPATRTFRVEISADNADLGIRDGQSANITIASAGTTAHKIPASALTLDNDGEMGVRTVDGEGIVGFVPVRIVRDTTDGVYVDGLPERARIIVVGQEYVTEGVAVDVTLRENGA